jgi:2-(1,2-epoxy-1,2-dihydrophenyl)acetyl-CoA isomerase
MSEDFMPDLLLEIRDNVARITINRPDAMNAMGFDMWTGMREMVREIEHDPQVRVVLITGAGANFCAGGDVKEFETTLDMTDRERAVMLMRVADNANPLFMVLERIPQPVVVSVRGIAAGGGLGLVAGADLAIVSENAKFFAAQIKIGAVPDSFVGYNLVRNIGVKRAKQYCLLGDILDARTALDAGLVNWVVPDAALEQQTDKLLARLVKMPGKAISLTKAELNAAHTRTMAEHMVQETLDIGACVADPAFQTSLRQVVARMRAKV